MTIHRRRGWRGRIRACFKAIFIAERRSRREPSIQAKLPRAIANGIIVNTSIAAERRPSNGLAQAQAADGSRNIDHNRAVVAIKAPKDD